MGGFFFNLIRNFGFKHWVEYVFIVYLPCLILTLKFLIMKKLLFFVALATLSFTAAQSQNVRFGAKAGVNFSSVNGDDFDDADGATGFHIGAVAKIGLTELLAIQPEILFSAQGYSVDLPGDDVKVRLGYINLPIMADFTIAEGLSLQGGPQFGFNVVSGYKYDGDDIEEFEEVEGIKSLDLGVGIGAQYILPINLFFQARYVIGFSDVYDEFDGGVQPEGKNSVISLSAGYFFN